LAILEAVVVGAKVDDDDDDVDDGDSGANISNT
jgi:hypothetical protein